MGPDAQPALSRAFVLRVAFCFFLAAALFLAWRLASSLVLLVGSVAEAVLIRSVAASIRRWTRLGDGLSVIAAIVLMVAAAGALAWLAGAVLAPQFAELQARLPSSLGALRADVAGWPLGGTLAARFVTPQAVGSDLHALVGWVGGRAAGAASAAASAIVALFIGAFLALEPRRSLDGLLMLFPKRPRAALAEAFDETGRALRLWLRGMIVVMVTVAALTALGAWAAGLPTPFALGAIGGVCELVPYVGPLISAVPGVVMAVGQGERTVIWTVVMYLAVHQFEGGLLYPFIQKRAADLPPALTLISVLLAGVLFGPFGVVLATPLLVVGLTLTRRLYIANALDEPPPPLA